MSMRRRYLGAALSVCVAAMTVTAVQNPASAETADSPQALSPVPTDSLSQQYRGQQVSWKYDNCTAAEKAARTQRSGSSVLAYRTVECADITVPVNYLEPDKASITVHALRVGAQMSPGEQPRTMFVNRGGPGGAAGTWALRVAGTMPDLLQNYQIVGLDPRGTGASSPIECQPASQDNLDTYRNSSHIGTNVDYGCIGKYTHAAFLGTENVARDFDLVRSLLGASVLDYYGVSYGTKLGRVYQSLFPSRSGRFVLDSNMLAPGVPQPATSQEAAFKRRGTQLTEWLARQNKTYQLGATAAKVTAAYEGVLKAADLGQLPGITRGDFESVWQSSAYSDSAFASFARSLTLARRYLANDPAITFAQVHDQLFSDETQSGYWNSTEFNTAASVLTTISDAVSLPVGKDWKIPAGVLAALKTTMNSADPGTSPDQLLAALMKPDTLAAIAKIAVTVFEVLSSIVRYGLPKSIADPSPFGDGELRFVPKETKSSGGNAAPFALMLQNEFDPATPWENAVALLGYFPNSKLVAVRGAGSHGVMPTLDSALSPSPGCAGVVLSRYLQRGERPAANQVCTAPPMPGDKASTVPADKSVAPGTLIDPWRAAVPS